jgi:hypothetical protein
LEKEGKRRVTKVEKRMDMGDPARRVLRWELASELDLTSRGSRW